MEFYSPRPRRGNEKPIMQHVQGDVMTEWRISDDRNHVVTERSQLDAPTTGPRAGTFFLGGMETTVDELADYMAEADERNARPKYDRLPDIQRRIGEPFGLRLSPNGAPCGRGLDAAGNPVTVALRLLPGRPQLRCSLTALLPPRQLAPSPVRV